MPQYPFVVTGPWSTEADDSTSIPALPFEQNEGVIADLDLDLFPLPAKLCFSCEYVEGVITEAAVFPERCPTCGEDDPRKFIEGWIMTRAFRGPEGRRIERGFTFFDGVMYSIYESLKDSFSEFDRRQKLIPAIAALHNFYSE